MSERLVQSVELIATEAVTCVKRYCPAWLAELLAEKEEALGCPVLVVARVVRRTFIGRRKSRTVTGITVYVIVRVLNITPSAEVYPGLKENGRILRELVLKAHSETMSVGAGGIISGIRGYKAASVVEIVGEFAVFGDIFVAAVIEVVSGKVHIPVKKSKCPVESAHPRGSDAVSASPAALSPAHSTATSSHIAHHRAGEVVESTIIGVIAIENETDLAFIGESSHHSRALIAPVVHIIARTRHVVSATGHNVSEPALHHSRLDGKVYHSLLISIVDAREHRLIRLFLHNLHLLDYLCRNVFRGKRRVIKEECLAIDGYLRYGLAVCSY